MGDVLTLASNPVKVQAATEYRMADVEAMILGTRPVK
jgi:hypothetical protein